MQSLFSRLLLWFGYRFISDILVELVYSVPQFVSPTAALLQGPWGHPLSTLEQKQRCRETERMIVISGC